MPCYEMLIVSGIAKRYPYAVIRVSRSGLKQAVLSGGVLLALPFRVLRLIFQNFADIVDRIVTEFFEQARLEIVRKIACFRDGQRGAWRINCSDVDMVDHAPFLMLIIQCDENVVPFEFTVHVFHGSILSLGIGGGLLASPVVLLIWEGVEARIYDLRPVELDIHPAVFAFPCDPDGFEFSGFAMADFLAK